MDDRMKTIMILMAACLIFSIQACGKKAPPVPPGAKVIPPVSDLKHSVQGDNVTITWKAPGGKASKAVSGYEVLRSSTSLDEKECEGCPIVFVRAARLGATQTSYSEKLTPGRRYIYKVVAQTSYQAPGMDPPLIRLSFPEEKTAPGAETASEQKTGAGGQ